MTMKFPFNDITIPHPFATGFKMYRNGTEKRIARIISAFPSIEMIMLTDVP